MSKIDSMQEIRRQDDTQGAYNAIYRDEGINQSDSFYLWLIGLLQPRPSARLLDISTGQGRLVVLAQRQGLRAVGMDFALDGVRLGKSQEAGASWSVSDGEKLPLPGGCIDYVTHIGSLEHYEHPLDGMREIARVLKPGGAACVLLPNSYGLLGNVKYVMQHGQIFDDGQPLQRYNTRQGWHDLLFEAGLRPYRTLKYEREWPRTWKDLRWYLARPAKIARLLISPLVPLNLGNCLVYLCRRA